MFTPGPITVELPAVTYTREEVERIVRANLAARDRAWLRHLAERHNR